MKPATSDMQPPRAVDGGDALAIHLATEALSAGRLAVLIDETRGVADLVLAAETVSAAAINFMAAHGRGLIALALSAERIAALGLPPMCASWEEPRRPFTVSIEARDGVATGISAPDRARTIAVAVAPGTRPDELVVPGHVFPLRAASGGLAAAQGRAETALALTALAGYGRGAVLCEILDDAGDQATGPDLIAFARRFQLTTVTMGAVIDAHVAREAAPRRAVA